MDAWGPQTPNQAHGDTVAVSLGVKHMLIRSHAEIMQHLYRFRVLDRNMRSLHHCFHEVLVDELPESPPELAVLHH